MMDGGEGAEYEEGGFEEYWDTTYHWTKNQTATELIKIANYLLWKYYHLYL